jgi:uncharacterized protein with PQ loop repeat
MKVLISYLGQVLCLAAFIVPFFTIYQVYKHDKDKPIASFLIGLFLGIVLGFFVFVIGMILIFNMD